MSLESLARSRAFSLELTSLEWHDFRWIQALETYKKGLKPLRKR